MIGKNIMRQRKTGTNMVKTIPMMKYPVDDIVRNDI